MALLDMNFMIPASCLNKSCTRKFFIPDSATKDSAYCPHCGSVKFKIEVLSRLQSKIVNNK